MSEWLSSINQQTTSVGEDVEKGNPLGMKMVAARVENSMDYLKKLKMVLPYDPTISLLVIQLKNPTH